MSTATCSQCGNTVSWRNRRGARLADLRCECGGAFRSLTAGKASRLKGKIYATCMLCGRRTIADYLIVMQSDREALFPARQIKAGAAVHHYHEFVISESEAAIIFSGHDYAVRPNSAPARDINRFLQKEERP